MTDKSKKWLSMLLVIAMLLSMLVVPAAAEEGDGTEEVPDTGTYAVAIDTEISGGTVTAEPAESVEPGAQVTVTVTSLEGFTLKEGSLSCTTEGEAAEVELSPAGEGSYTFQMPEDNVVLTAVFEALPGTSLTGGDIITGGTTITEDGTYQLAEGAGGVITIGEGVSEVTLVGGGAEWDEAYTMTTTPCSNLYIDCTAVPGVTLTLEDCYISNNSSQTFGGIIGFKGSGNTLCFEGVNVLDYNIGGGANPAAIHVDTETELSIEGSGTLYFYKSAQGSGIGGSTGELNGDITFSMTGAAFLKGTKQGALVGAGSNSKNVEGVPGKIVFESGSYNLVSNSRGAAIGGSAGAGGGSAGTNVYVKGGTVNINVDYTGAAVGGGGYATGNDASGGTIYISGGSLRTYVDENAANGSETGYQGAPYTAGINDAAITAARKDGAGSAVYKCIFDTALLETPAASFDVQVDGTAFYSGGLHGYGYVQEGLDKGEQITISSTPSNWYENGDTCLYFYLTAGNHVLTVNGERFNVTYDAEAAADPAVFTTSGPFTVAHELPTGNPDADVWDGTLDFSWYDEHDVKTEYHITKPAQWAALAWICSEHLGELGELGAESYTAGNITGITGTIPTAQNKFEGVTFYLDSDLDMGGVYDAETGAAVTDGNYDAAWSGPNYYPVGAQAVNDRGDGIFYGLFYGCFDGQGHLVKNIRCVRTSGTSAAKNGSQSMGLFGRLGAADNTAYPETDIIIENVAVDGYIHGYRSTGGVVGKTLHVGTGHEILIRGCMNFADVYTLGGAKGTGGVAATLWNGAKVSDCANFGNISGNYTTANTAGVSGAAEGPTSNSYNVGLVTNSARAANTGAVALNQSAADVTNCYALEGSAPGYPSSIVNGNTLVSGGWKTEDEMKTPEFAALLGAAWVLPGGSVKLISSGLAELAGGYPVPKTMTVEHTYSEKWSSDDTHHWHACTVSGCTDVADRAGHTWDAGVVTLEPTAGTSGSKTYTCTVCGKNKVETIPATGGGSGTGGGPGTDVDTSGLDLTSSNWDGISVDVSWYLADETQGSYTIYTAAELAGVAALVNGLINNGCKVYTGEEVLSAEKWNNSAYVKNGSGTSGGNNQSTNDYSYGVENFDGWTIALGADLDMSAGNYMPIGGQYLMHDENTSSKIGSSFCGFLDGQGHSVTIQCDRHCSANYGDGQSVGFIGRLGVHDNDGDDLRPTGAGVCDLAVYGSVKANRSVGGIVGKIGKTSDGAVIEGCANFADVSGTDAKGTGGIVGAAWNGGVIRNCYNAGDISNTHNAYGGIAGSCEIEVVNCYNAGKITGAGTTAAIASDNGGSTYENCYWLTGTADVGVYNITSDQVVEKTASEMKSAAFVDALGSAFTADTKQINSGYPVLSWQNPGGTTGSGSGGLGGGSSAAEKPEMEETEASATTEVSNGKATVTVDSEALSETLESAKPNTQIVISADLDGEDVDEVTLVLTGEDVSALAGAGVSLRAGLELAGVTLSNTALKDLAEEKGDEITLTAAARKDGVYIGAAVDGKAMSQVEGGVRVTLPVSNPTGGTVLILVGSDGTETVIKKSAVVEGGVCAILEGSCTVRAEDRSRTFADVKSSDWFAGAVAFVSSRELFQGVSDAQFAPTMPMTRAMLVTVLHRLEDQPGAGAAASFGDVPAGAWYALAVAWASENSIVTGTGSGFNPDGNVTREQIAAILYRYMRYLGLDVSASGDLSKFSDGGETSGWAEDAMKWAVGAGILTGKSGTILDPTGTASRAEVATMLQRLVNLMI